MKNFVKLSKNEMKMVVGGLVDSEIGEEGGGEVHKCNGNGTSYQCPGTQLECTVACSNAFGSKCGGCS